MFLGPGIVYAGGMDVKVVGCMSFSLLSLVYYHTTLPPISCSDTPVPYSDTHIFRYLIYPPEKIPIDREVLPPT